MPAPITFAAAGDVQLGDSSICPGFGVASRAGPDGADGLFETVRDALTADVCVVNLETVLSTAGLDPGAWRSMQMRGRPEYAGALARAGITVANVANNHALQHGEVAFRETIAHLDAAGVAVCGVKGDPPWASRPARIDLEAASVGILGYSLRPRQFSEAPPPYAEGRPEEMIADVRRLTGTVDHVVVVLHWGEEFVARPSAAEVELGRTLVETGAGIIVGHHPHVLRPVERVGRSVIAYSLGNLVSDMVWYEPLREGGILRARLTRDPSGPRIEEVELVRTRIGDDFRPSVTGRDASPMPELEGLGADAYGRAIADSIRSQRLAAYRFALRHVHRYPPRLLSQLARRTMANKLLALLGRT